MAARIQAITPPGYEHQDPRRPLRPSKSIGITTSLAMRLHMDPSETTISQQEVAEMAAPRAIFHNYLRAFYPFDPSTSDMGGEEDLLMTASMKPGDLILIHAIHANGWADGTVLTSGERGWLPTNYCEAYDHPHLRNLLNAMTQFWDLLGANDDANLSAFVRQDYIRGLIAGVRHLLEHADCLHRDAPQVQRHTGIRRMRKGLLADLSSLVQIAKGLQEMISASQSGDVIHYLLEDLVAKAFKVVTRAVGFQDIWTKQTAEPAPVPRDVTITEAPLSPVFESGVLTVDVQASRNAEIAPPVDSARSFPLFANPIDEPDAICGAEETEEPRSRRESAASRSRKRSVSHRLSLVNIEHVPPDGLASTRLAKVHDVCIGQIGAFIGHHLQTRSSPDLVDKTERVVKGCKALLAVIEDIRLRDTQRSGLLHHASIDVQAKLEELVRATKDVFTFSDAEDGDVVMLPEQSKRLVAVGTGLIRMAGDCVNKARLLIEQIGDFELEDTALPTQDIAQPVQAGAPNTEAEALPAESTPARGMTSFEKRLSKKVLPPLPLANPHGRDDSDRRDFASDAPSIVSTGEDELTPLSADALKTLATPSMRRRSAIRKSHTPISGTFDAANFERNNSVGQSIAGSTATYRSNIRHSDNSAVSEVSTRATTPDRAKEINSPDPALLDSFMSMSSMQSLTTDTADEAEMQLLHKTFANELTLNKDGQVTGGSLPALVEQLTTHDSAPDPQFVSAFFLTFRMFTTPREFALALTTRFDYAGESREIGTPVRLRIYNVFKGWLETYWNAGADKDALGDIRYFALHKLKPYLPSAGERLLELTRKVTSGYCNGATNPPLVSGVGKSSMSIAAMNADASTAPEPLVTRSQSQALKAAAKDGSPYNIVDIHPFELARQLTLITSRIFCDIRPDELLSLEWGKRSTDHARNVRAMCTINTDLAHVVGDTILTPNDAKKRALVIKHWSKVGTRCLELNNYDSLVAIMCSINSSVVSRLRRTWEAVSKTTKLRLADLNAVIDLSRNQASLRKRFETQVPPCIPFLGIYLTDLTFLDAGNPKTRELPHIASPDGQHAVSVINFDKYSRMAKIISHLQKFQVPYLLQSVPEMQAWMEASMVRMRASNDEMVGNFHRRSLMVEPRQDEGARAAGRTGVEGRRMTEAGEERPKTGNKDKLEGFLKGSTFSLKSMGTAAQDGASV
ncbi:Ras guanine nucleotide exchange factor bud5 [Friedmanniomyces endolithicus]|uniref:Ras guanine nucleotide exchange factor bud5 n=1 Tax=Friedmanniomyces endolithicus TaxID=329885 RepID=A0AAN6KIF2_9PEZI|nr:Ras guanine nucleotide exchange factor bud5 [Friedmanniomyces endolithicus]KAK0801841.1 Ras guanine nucleotide exchange factor bud5 [Friedmanniomyces endolithicus]KAK0851603.1 Ras guanine nucleotide exchange factor bud5 [Friedmanniomyces endolithicus]KAK0858649.1 Ras guanine nucleotide exchange factor bud5 [Friedmanniomyces endolithicus]KAK0885854.1 Ras guanine nucleotide exchange factor bud5 [Friedmanniomyces endolithicus]